MSTHDAKGPSVEELRLMDTEALMRAGAEDHGVHIVHREIPFSAVPGSKAEKRAERTIALMFQLVGVLGALFVIAYILMPWHWTMPGDGANQYFRFYTPVLGGLLAGMLILFGLGIVMWAKWLMPHETVVQERHDEVAEADRLTAGATLAAGAKDLNVARRPLLVGSLLMGGGALATAPLIALVGSMIKSPGKKLFHTLYSPDRDVVDFKTGASMKAKDLYPNGVPLVLSDGRRVGPDTLQAGGQATVFPGLNKEDPEIAKKAIRNATSPTLLIRLRPGQVEGMKVRKIKGRDQRDFAWGDYVAFSKICTHAGCPASLYEQQTTRMLCPCHQSQFAILQDAKPVFGPATRALPKLPLGIEMVDGVPYFVAREDYPEAIGPGFWERP